jgi:hypothetical protein
VASTYTLATDGDILERRCAVSFLGECFPQYEAFWLERVVPLTRRPRGVGLKSDGELVADGFTRCDVANAQLHYTVLFHLSRAYDIRTIAANHRDSLIEVFVRLGSATDVADELLQRVTSPSDVDSADSWGNYGTGLALRDKWRRPNGRKGDPRPGLERVDLVRHYRNELVHGGVPPCVTNQYTGVLYAPSLSQALTFRDWRTIADADGNPLRELLDDQLVPLSFLFDEAWERVLTYLSQSWSEHLLPVSTESPSSPPPASKFFSTRAARSASADSSFTDLS